ncbi:MAG: RNB domain-containing ribonuclease [Oligosphaeraceae bacterium]|nr:RNB domain-containing ribonuclease [Oligosphaeraceae bacterium]
MFVEDNSIIDYFANNEMCLGIVVKGGDERLQVQGVLPPPRKVSARQVLTIHGKAKKDYITALALLQERIQETMAEIDVELLWADLLERGGGSLTLEDICRHYFAAAEPLQLSAMARKLAADNLHFQRQGQEFSPRTAEGIAELERLRQERAAKAALKERQRAWLSAVLNSSTAAGPAAVPAEMEPFVKLTLDYLLCGFNSEAVNLLSDYPQGKTARETALRLLKKLSRLPENADEFLLVNGIHAAFPAAAAQHADALPDFETLVQERARRRDLCAEYAFSIDDAETREIDDALSVRPSPAGGLRVGIHLAAPSCLVSKDDILDAVAVERPLSLYLPTTVVTMFPERLGCDLASLEAGKLRPALSFLVEFSPEGELLDWEMTLSQIKVARRLTYHAADALLATGEGETGAALQALQRLGGHLRQVREEAGAVSLNRPELKITVRGNEISLHEDDPDTPSHNLVQEFMILANHLAARYALRHEIPIIYRVQDMSSEPVHPVHPYHALDFDREVRKMKRTRLSTCPQPHAGLGLDLYTQVSSPLRRYADLVIQRQLTAHLCAQALPYTQEELFAVLDNVESTTSQNRALEREARRYWVLEYLRRTGMDQDYRATIVRLEGVMVLAELAGFYERGVVMTRDRHYPGEELQVRLQEVKPQLGRLVMTLAR